MRRTCLRIAVGTLSWLALAGAPLAAQVAKPAADGLDGLTRVSQRLALAPDFVPLAEGRDAVAPEAAAALDAFLRAEGGTWTAHVDTRSGRIGSLLGSGLPWIPGGGNQLRLEDLRELLAGSAAPDLAALDRKARQAAPDFAKMFGFDPEALRLDPGRSGNPTPHVWFVDYDVLAGGHVVEGARVVFTVNSGNLISVEAENLPALDARVPATAVSAEEAWATVAREVGAEPGDETVDAGSFHLLPAHRLMPGADGRPVPGVGRDLVGLWQFVFRRVGVMGTWRARIDAATGLLEDFGDTNDYGKITGGVHKTDGLPADTVVPMPYANYATSSYANSAGLFAGTAGTTALNGQFVRIVDTCGPISKAADAAGTIALGSSTGTNCTTPGSGGGGNTRASRTQFYHLNRAKENGMGWLPANAWLSAKLTANVNINNVCNAYWNGSTVNFFRSGGGCNNTGEIPGVSLHEWAHGLDSNDGSAPSTEKGTGETYGDWTAALMSHRSCVGGGFLSANCGGYGNACTSCTGVRDIDYAKHSNNTAATPHNFTGPLCPYDANQAGASDYVGPCGLDRLADGNTLGEEGHCESQVSSEALWDLANRDLPGAGAARAWTIADRLWYLSRSTAGRAFTCETSGGYLNYTSNGCNTGSSFRVLRAVDDDNGNLADGTPHGGAIAAAFNRHGIACTSDAGWNLTHAGTAPPAAPVLAATPGNNQVSLSWSGSTGVYDVFRNETSCTSGFTRIGNDLAATAATDPSVANGVTYYYQVVAQPAGNESAASAPSNCVSVTPTASVPTACVPSSTKLCLNNGRFGVSITWRNYQNQTGVGTTVAIPGSTDSGLFWFFNASNIEFLVKVLNGCGINSRYWVLAAATTDVEYSMTVVDHNNGTTKTYTNPLGTASPAIIDTAAFATCP